MEKDDEDVDKNNETTHCLTITEAGPEPDESVGTDSLHPEPKTAETFHTMVEDGDDETKNTYVLIEDPTILVVGYK